jgi:hypothetical protein
VADGVTPHRLAATVLAALLAAGCAGPVAASRAVSALGVEMRATAGAWRGWPSELDRMVTPIRVSLTNGGAVPLRLDVTRFGLALPAGGRLAAVLPADVHGVVVEPPPAALPAAGAALGPTPENSGPGWALNEPGLDPHKDPALAPGRAWELPSADMLALALPEGVLAPGQTAAGFVYFERAPRGVTEVTLTTPLVEANGASLGVLALPLSLR